MTKDDAIKLARAVGFRIERIDGIDEVLDCSGQYIQTEKVMALIFLVERRERAEIGEWVADACQEQDVGSIALAIMDCGHKFIDYFETAK